jgi:AcrR family transcriptional regulator
MLTEQSVMTEEESMAPRSREDNEATRAASRARILAAARTLFAQRGFASCRVADIARRAGMSPANVYWHFDSKEAILRAILDQGFANLEAMAAGVADEYGPARRKLDLLLERTLALYTANAEFPVILGGLMGEGGRDLIRSLGFDLPEMQRRYRSDLRRVFAEARSEGALAPADPDLLVAFYLAFFDGLCITRGDLWPALPRDALRDAALRLVGYRPAG